MGFVLAAQKDTVLIILMKNVIKIHVLLIIVVYAIKKAIVLNAKDILISWIIHVQMSVILQTVDGVNLIVKIANSVYQQKVLILLLKNVKIFFLWLIVVFIWNSRVMSVNLVMNLILIRLHVSNYVQLKIVYHVLINKVNNV